MPESTSMPVEQARKKLGEIVTRAAADDEATVITKNGVPAAAVVPLEWLRRMQGA
jgi:prevent-host-death family protein